MNKWSAEKEYVVGMVTLILICLVLLVIIGATR